MYRNLVGCESTANSRIRSSTYSLFMDWFSSVLTARCTYPDRSSPEITLQPTRGFQPAEIDASKVLLDTFPLLFVHVVLR